MQESNKNIEIYIRKLRVAFEGVAMKLLGGAELNIMTI